MATWVPPACPVTNLCGSVQIRLHNLVVIAPGLLPISYTRLHEPSLSALGAPDRPREHVFRNDQEGPSGLVPSVKNMVGADGFEPSTSTVSR